MPTVPSTLEKLHAASLRELETLVADNVTLQQELQRHARSPQLEETATKNATGTEGGSQGGEGSDRGARSEGLREGGVQRAEQFGGGAATDGGRALERNEKEGVRLAESGAGCHGRERDEEKYDVDDDVTGSVDLSSQPKSRESDIFEKLSSSERKPALAGLAAGARLTLGLTSAEKRGLEQGSSGFQRGLGRELPNAFESGVKIWGGDISARGGPKAWFNPVFVEEEGGQEGRRDSGEGGGLGLGAAIAEVVGDRDRLLKQNGRLVMEVRLPGRLQFRF